MVGGRLLTFWGATGALAWKARQAELKAKAPPVPAPGTPGAAGGPGAEAPPANVEASWDDLVPVDTLSLEVGYRLIALVDKERKGDLLGRIKGVRKKFAQDVGFLPPPVHIRDNLELKPSMYRVSLRGAVIGEAEAFRRTGSSGFAVDPPAVLISWSG